MAGNQYSTVRSLPVLLALLLALPIGVPLAAADSATQVTTLPGGRANPSSVWDAAAGQAYIFGGSDGGYTNTILRYTPATNTVTAMGATLPTGHEGSCAFWDAATSRAYILGGFTGTGYLNTIIRYTPSTGAVSNVGSLPAPMASHSCAWDGTNAYIFGGTADGTPTNQILRYNPSTGAVTTMGATLPTTMHYTAAFWDGAGNAYVVGGYIPGTESNQIIRYTPATNIVTTMTATLPAAMTGVSVAWAGGGNAYIFGGKGGATFYPQILRYTPSTNTVAPTGVTLPSSAGAWLTTAVWDATNAKGYIFGGITQSFTYGDSVVRYAADGGGCTATDTLTIESGALPTIMSTSSAVWTGSSLYMFGGRDTGSVALSSIVKYTPSTGAVSPMSATLPGGRWGTSAVWTGQYAYIFGGYDGGYTNQILRYDPAADSLATMAQTLPSGRFATAAAWDGTSAYIFGGNGGGSSMSSIVKYTPSTGAVSTLSATLPSGVHYLSAASDGTNAYIFGGRDAAGTPVNTISRFNPATATLTVMPATLPSARSATAAAWNGNEFGVFGGAGTQIVKYVPSTNTVTASSATLPSSRGGMSAVANGDTIYALSGDVFGSPDGRQIMKFTSSCGGGNPTAPGAPTGLTATPSVGQIDLFWSAPSSNGGSAITNYKVYRGTASGGETLLTTLGNVLSYNDPAVTVGATYYYKVSAVNTVGEGPQSNEAAATVPSLPSAPLGLSASASTTVAGRIQLTWSAPSSSGGSPITNYVVYRSTTSGGETPLTTLGNVLSHTDNGLANGQTYYYKVSAVNSAGQGPQSNEASATTPNVPSAPRFPSATASTSSAGRIDVAWSAPSSTGGAPVLGYNLYRSTSSGSETLAASLGNVLTYADTGLALGQTYYYKVSARNIAAEGPQSTGFSATTANVPSPPTLTAQNILGNPPGRNQLNWNTPTDGGSPITGYKVYRSTTSGSETLIATLGNVHTYNDDTCSIPSTCFYQVSARNAVGEGGRSNQARAGIVPDAVRTATPAAGADIDPTVCGLGQSYCNYVNAPPSMPSISGPASRRPSESGTYSFSATDPDSDTMTVRIEWGDGYVTTTNLPATVSHAYSSVGSYCLRAQATDAHSTKSAWSNCKIVLVETNKAPLAPNAPSGPASVDSGVSTPFTATTTDPESDAIVYTFDWGDGTSSNSATRSSGQSATFNHAWYSGSYCVRVRATDSYAAPGPWSACKTIAIVNIPPQIPTVSGPTSVMSGIPHTFSATSNDVDSASMHYEFDFGESEYWTNTVPVGQSGFWTYAYMTPGQPWCLRVTAVDSEGNRGSPSACHNVYVTNSPPAKPGIPTGPSSGTAGQSLSYTVSTTDPSGEPIKYYIDWGDGWLEQNIPYQDPGTVTTRPHTWSSSGTYCIKMRALDLYGDYGPWSDCKTVGIGVPAQPPSAPLSVVATPTAGGQVTVTWSAPSSTGGAPITGYRVYSGVAANNLQVVGETSGALSFAHTGFNEAGTRLYRVSAVNSQGEGVQSTQKSTVAYHDYTVELKAWIPHLLVTDPMINDQSWKWASWDDPRGCNHNYVCARTWDNWASGTEICHGSNISPDRVDGSYEGDNHAAYDGSHRVISAIKFRWDGFSMSNVQQPSGPLFGETKQYRNYWQGSTSQMCLMARETVTSDSSFSGSGDSFTLHYSAVNPIAQRGIPNFVVPKIDGTMEGRFGSNGDLLLQYETDQFPSHGLRVKRNDVPQFTFNFMDASCVDGDNADDIKEGLTNSRNGAAVIYPWMSPNSTYPAAESPLCP